MLRRSDFKNNTRLLITNLEMVSLLLAFSLILFFLFPGKQILDYAIEEKDNLELAELYLKKIYEKYPEKEEIFLALAETYIKNNKLVEAEKLIKQSNFKDPNTRFKIEMLNIKVKIEKLKNEEEFEEIYNFFIQNAKRFSKEDMDIVYDFNKHLIERKIKDKVCSFMIDFYNNHNNRNLKNEIAFRYINFLRKNLLISSCYKNLENFYEIALENNELAYQIIKLYLEAGKPFLASEFAYKVLKRKKVI